MESMSGGAAVNCWKRLLFKKELIEGQLQAWVSFGEGSGSLAALLPWAVVAHVAVFHPSF